MNICVDCKHCRITDGEILGGLSMEDFLTIEEKRQLFGLLNKIAVHGSRYMSFTYQTPVAKTILYEITIS